MKKISLLLVLLLAVVFVAGCQKKPKEMMDVLNKDGYYHYVNQDLNFGLYLPPDFIYYQTQRKNNDKYTDIEVFVPTADKAYHQEVPGYAKPIVVRVFDKKYWQGKDQAEQGEYSVAAEKGNRLYALRFWEAAPSDWQPKWTAQMKDNIIKMFETR